MSPENLDLLKAWIEAFNSRDDDTIARLHHPAIEWQTRNWLRGEVAPPGFEPGTSRL
jgi:hypothetical protein